MRAWLVAIGCLFGGCEAAGIELVIDTSGDPGATEVRLYLGDAKLADGMPMQLAPARFTPSDGLGGRVWELDDPSYAHVHAIIDGNVRVQFGVDGPGTLSVIAVGLTGGQPTSVATLFDLALKPDRVLMWDLALAPARATTPTGVGREVQLWGVTSNDQTCVNATALDQPFRRAFLVSSKQDKDCDGFRDGDREECDDLWHGAMVRPRADNLDCVGTPAVVDPANGPFTACMVGGPRCTDGSDANDDEACSHALPYCAAQALCAVCESGDPQERFECLLDPSLYAPNAPNAVPYVQCDLQYEDRNGEAHMCAQTVSFFVPNVQASACPTDVPMFRSRRHPGWASKLQIGGVPIQLGRPLGSAECKIELQVEATDMADPLAFPRAGLLAATATAGRGLVVPLVLRAVPGPCTVAPSCTLMHQSTDPTARDCVRFAPTDPISN